MSTTSARLADAVYVTVGLLVVAGTAADIGGHRGNLAAATFAVTGVVAVASLLWRRSRPLLPVVLAVPSMLASTGLGLLPLAVFALAIRRRDRVTWAVAAGGYLVAVALNAATGELAGSLVSDALTLGLAVAAGAYLGARRDLLASLRVRAEQAEAELALRSDQARLAERTRIAQEMHDVLAHRISLIGLHAGGLEVRPDAGAEVVERSATLIRETARAALEDLRGVLGVLRADASAEGADLAPQPQLSDLPRLVESSAAAGVPVTLTLDVPEPAAAAPPEVTGRTVYRVVQEALTNVHKHARGARTRVVVDGEPGAGLAVEVVNVRPVAAASLLPGAGFGLVGLRERVALAGGTLEAGPTPEGGWRVRAWFPWPTP